MEPIKVILEFKTGFSIRSGYGLSGVLDGVIMKDHKELPYIPGPSLKGIIRQACEELAQVKGYVVYENVVSELKALKADKKDINNPENLSQITRIFGSPFSPSLFQFHSAYLSVGDDKEAETVKLLSTWAESHNSISRETGTAMKDHLFTYEIAGKEQGLAEFSGYSFEFTISPRVDEIDPRLTSLLLCGIRFADRIGANKSRGKGVVDMKIQPPYGEEENLKKWIAITFPGEEVN